MTIIRPSPTQMTSKRLSVLALGAAAASVVAQNPAPRNDSVSPYLDAVSKFIDSIEDDLWSINKKIYDNPELGMEEVKAHDILTSYMESQAGWTVERSLYNFTTAFAAVFEGDRDGPVVSFNAEYGGCRGNRELFFFFKKKPGS